jgi:lipopolysaccharide transport system permease protein
MDRVLVQDRIRQFTFVFSQLVRRDVERRYRGTAAGLAWAVIHPLTMIAIYTVIFGMVFKPRWPEVESTWDYVLILFLGKIPFLFMTEALARSSGTIHAHVNLVKRSAFSLGMLPMVGMGTGLFNAVIAMIIWVVFHIAIKGSFPTGILVIPVLWLPMVLFCLGACWVVAALGAYFRDTEQVVGSFNIALMFLSPIFYPSESLPQMMRNVLQWNPLTFAIEASRGAALWGFGVDWENYFMQLAASVFVAVLGYLFFRRVRPGFADVV